MKEATFIEKVRQMRENQKAYFKTKHPYYMEQSKKLEKQVDAELSVLSASLFPGHEPEPEKQKPAAQDFKTILTTKRTMYAYRTEQARRNGDNYYESYYQGCLAAIDEILKAIEK